MHTSYMQVYKKAMRCCCNCLRHVTPSNNQRCQPMILQYFEASCLCSACFLVQAAALLNQQGKTSKLRQASLPLLCSAGANYIYTDTWCTDRKSQRCRPSCAQTRTGLSNIPSVSYHNCHLQSLTKLCPRNITYRTVSHALFCASASPSSKPFTAATHA